VLTVEELAAAVGIPPAGPATQVAPAVQVAPAIPAAALAAAAHRRVAAAHLLTERFVAA
jgi:hypothetical protein